MKKFIILVLSVMAYPLSMDAQNAVFNLIGKPKAALESSIQYQKSIKEFERIENGVKVTQYGYILGKEGDYHIGFINDTVSAVTFEPLPKPLKSVFNEYVQNIAALKQVNIEYKEYEGTVMVNDKPKRVVLKEYTPTGRVTKITVQ